MARPTLSVVLIGDLPDASVSACRIEQPTHKRLWSRLREYAAKEWETTKIAWPFELLRQAERASGVELGESALRRQMIRIIEHVLIPAVVLERIWQELEEYAAAARAAGHVSADGRRGDDPTYEVAIVGAGWHRCLPESQQFAAASSLENLARVAESDASGEPSAPTLVGSMTRPTYQSTTSETPAPQPVCAAVFAGPLDPLNPVLFEATAAGWPILIHSPGGVSLTPMLGGILHPQQHYTPFSGSQDLRAALDAIRANPERARHRSAVLLKHLQEHQTYEQRLTTFARQLGAEWPELIRSGPGASATGLR